MLTTVPIATTASYLPLLANAFARMGSSKLPGTQATYFRAHKYCSQTLVTEKYTWYAQYAGKLCAQCTFPCGDLTSTASLSPPCRSKASSAPSRSSFVTRSLNLAMTIANLRSCATRLPTYGFGLAEALILAEGEGFRFSLKRRGTSAAVRQTELVQDTGKC